MNRVGRAGSWTGSSARVYAMITGCAAALIAAGVPPVLAAAPGATTQPSPDSPTLIVALLQMKPALSDQAANLAKADRFCRDAAARGAHIALMPEMWNIGYTRFDPKKPGARDTFFRTAVPTDGP